MLIACIMGGTCTGKTTFIEHTNEKRPDIAAVEVGKMMRMKYSPDHFKGQAAPEHTRAEAWDMCERGIAEAYRNQYKVCLIDGQPRSLDQVEKMEQINDLVAQRITVHHLDNLLHVRYILLTATMEERQRRASLDKRKTRTAEDIELTRQRLVNDNTMYFDVLAELSKRGRKVNVVDTTHVFNPDYLLRRIEATAIYAEGGFGGDDGLLN